MILNFREGLAGLDETLEEASGFVDDLWKLKGQVYSEERMKSLLDIFGNELVILVENLISGVRYLIIKSLYSAQFKYLNLWMSLNLKF